jgi:arylsulfatase
MRGYKDSTRRCGIPCSYYGAFIEKGLRWVWRASVFTVDGNGVYRSGAKDAKFGVGYNGGMRPNIVFIAADQMRGDCLGVDESQHPVMTPHLDQLAWEGLHFRQAYADCPVCMPQRATMLTGQVASRFGMPHNFMGGHARTPIQLEESLPYRLSREAGYQTKAIGKMHFEPSRARFGFDHVTLHPDDYVVWLAENGYGGEHRGHGLGGNEVYPTTATMPEAFYHTHWIVDESIKFLAQRDPDCPFFLWMFFEAPHSPFDPPEPFDRMYDRIPVPEPVVGDWVGAEDEPRALRRSRLSKKADTVNGAILAETRRRYYGQISHIDFQLGRFLGELKKRFLYDNTLIVFTSDHGEHLGDHVLFAKYTFLQSAARIPLVMKPPQGVDGAATDMAVLTADIPATILDVAGLEPGEAMDGVSLLPYRGDRDRIVCGETDDSAFAADGVFKYIYYPDGGVEHLFNVRNDPDDMHDLGAHPARERLRSALIDFLAGFERPMVADGALVRVDHPLDEEIGRAHV